MNDRITRRPRSRLGKRPPSVELCRSQVGRLADRLAPLAANKTRETLAAELGVKEHVVEDVLHRRARVTMTLPHFEALTTKLGVDARGWDVSRS